MADRTLVLLIDALGWELAEYHAFSIDCLSCRTRLRSVLGFSQAALTSILTGTMPDVHGLWMMYSFNEQDSPFRFMKYLKKFGFTKRLWLRKFLRWKISKVEGVTSYYSLYDIPGSILSCLDLPARNATFGLKGGGSRRSIIDSAHEKGNLFIRDYNTPEDRAMDELESALQRGESSFHIVYTAALDYKLHHSGKSDKAVGEMLRSYAERVDMIAAKFPDLRIFVLGDHGMCDVSRHIDLINVMEGSGLEVPVDYIPFYDSTMARFSVRDRRAKDIVTGILGEIAGGRILPEEELVSLGVYFPDGRYGEIVYLCDPGTVILPSFMGRSPMKGMHGYHPGAGCMDSIMLSNVEFHGEDSSVAGIAGFLLPGFKGGELKG